MKLDVLSYEFQPIDSKMYIIPCEGEAIIIDPCVDSNAKKMLDSKKIKYIMVILTHEHYDHISGINWLRENYKCKVIASETCAKNMKLPKKNLSSYFEIMFLMDEEKRTQVHALGVTEYSCLADQTFNGRIMFDWKGHRIEIIETPGHSEGSSCILLDDKYLFSGDTVLNGLDIITKLPGGSKMAYQTKTLPILGDLCRGKTIYPGHGDVFDY